MCRFFPRMIDIGPLLEKHKINLFFVVIAKSDCGLEKMDDLAR